MTDRMQAVGFVIAFILAIFGLPVGAAYWYLWGASESHSHRTHGPSPFFHACAVIGLIQAVVILGAVVSYIWLFCGK